MASGAPDGPIEALRVSASTPPLIQRSMGGKSGSPAHAPCPNPDTVPPRVRARPTTCRPIAPRAPVTTTWWRWGSWVNGASRVLRAARSHREGEGCEPRGGERRGGADREERADVV